MAFLFKDVLETRQRPTTFDSLHYWETTAGVGSAWKD